MYSDTARWPERADLDDLPSVLDHRFNGTLVWS